MKKYFSIIVFCMIIISFTLVMGCSTTNNSVSNPVSNPITYKKTNLNIGDNANLSSSNGEKISIRLINIAKIPKNSRGVYYPYDFNEICFEIKNIGNKAISGTPVKYWVIDWAGVEYGGLEYVPSRYPREVSRNHNPFYPGDVDTMCYGFPLSVKSLEGKITFHYQFYNDEASWIITPK